MDSLILFNDTTGKLCVNELKKLRKWISETSQEEDYFVGELGFVFCTDDYLHRINVEFLNHDTFTDIITFDYCTADTIAGEIYISLDRVSENAQALSQDFSHELRRIIIHGVLHLLGYKDKSPEEKALMTSKENYYLSLLPKSE